MSLSHTWYSQFIKPLLFLSDPEEAHRRVCLLLKRTPSKLTGSALRRIAGVSSIPSSLAIKALGKSFSHPIGLAAGFDKDASYLPGLFALGFSHIEVGTITPREQVGNPKPRVFRVPSHEALINRLGFPSKGALEVSQNLKNFKKKYPFSLVGINVGKQKSTSLDEAHADYAYVVRIMQDYASYIAINVSSPNTPGLRGLQKEIFLRQIIGDVRKCLRRPLPILVKIAPDMTDGELDIIVSMALDEKVDGLIATNTTVDKTSLGVGFRQEGGLSGRPLRSRSNEVVKRVAQRSKGALTIIAVGGISSPQDVITSLKSGASLVQLYTALVYQGPLLVYSFIHQLSSLLEKEGVQSLQDLIGVDIR